MWRLALNTALKQPLGSTTATEFISTTRLLNKSLSCPGWRRFAGEAAPSSKPATPPGFEPLEGGQLDLNQFRVSPARRRIATFFRIFLPVSATSCLVYAFTHPDEDQGLRMPPELQYLAAQQTENENVLTNWSATHEARPKRFFQPENEGEVEAFLRQASKAKQQLRVMGSALSPNGLGLSQEGTLSMALMDRILKVDPEKKQVTVQAGCRVQQVADALKPYGLTLQNYASIREQQIGGFIQVGAHGTGARIPPVDEQVGARVLAQSPPAPSGGTGGATASGTGATAATAASTAEDAQLQHRLEPLRNLYQAKQPGPEADEMTTAMQLRDALLAMDPLNKSWVEEVNKAEAEYWKRSGGVRVGFSDEILGFDCGGQQWVLETALPVGKLDSLKGSTKDIEYMEALLKEIKSNKVAAHSPIEQRWTSGSSSTLSPVAGEADEVFSWVGIIMYLPEDPATRERVTDAFRAYARIVEERLMPCFNATWHWAKLEVPQSEAERKKLQARISKRYPVDKVGAYREVLDPQNVLANDWVNAVLPQKS
ncbi:hypothetical protein DUNSADRAFT_11056 [Dunaliella salina]|uniref:FAD-binding PCMH-type domain-containing protein n=1 Tax=Dunaliella salina TaxID=3046 RepID=A0ABQ7GE71_DUNSA|nr:hypothetical protein DUNSADRAFT_11056 [Dunaliella salina]|eukprot:KAF5832906.1 hypothetical protein DUNSADRAFT_11056 [Dunaliella salina]